MRPILILVTLILSLSMPAFSQNSTGDPVPPSTQFLESVNAAKLANAVSKFKNDHLGAAQRAPADVRVDQNKKKSSYMMIETYTGLLLSQVNRNIKNECNDDQNPLLSIGGLLVYIHLRQTSAGLSKAMGLNSPKIKDCTNHYTACLFKGQALKTLASLAQEKYLVDYLHEQEFWPTDDAKKVVDYFKALGQYLKPKQ